VVWCVEKTGSRSRSKMRGNSVTGSVGFSRLPFCHQLELVNRPPRNAASRLQPAYLAAR
jgi:hypothetical protein